MKTVIVGLDGVPFGLVRDLARQGVMANTARLISRGTFTKLDSSIPEVSAVAWSSVVTGENPGVHGIFGFTELVPATYKVRFPNSEDLQAPPFWERWTGRSVIINVPATYPARRMNGVLISGFVAVDFQKSVYPETLIPALAALGYRLDVDTRKAHSSLAAFLEDLDLTLESRIKSYRYLWASQEWQTFVLVFTGTDRLMHFLWDAYEEQGHEYHDRFVEYFRRIDRVIGEIHAELADEDLLLVHSDHGFERLEKDIYANYVLAESGFLRLDADRGPGLEGIDEGTTAFALDPGRIYLHRAGRYPRGRVDLAQAEKLLTNIADVFLALEVDGRKVVRAAHRKEDIYAGPFLAQAPDLVLVASEGFNLRGKAPAEVLAEKSIFTGKHTPDTGFLLVRGPVDGKPLPPRPAVSDIKAIAESRQSVAGR
jgi:predicted AlkP superfamily phosphohydrolase/phosphomutase